MLPSVAIAEDDGDLRRTLERGLAEEGFDVAVAASGGQPVRRGRDSVPAAPVIDIGLPHSARRDGARNPPRGVRGAAATEAAGARDERGHRHRARRGLQAGLTVPAGIRRRLVLAAAAATALGLAGVTLAFNLVLAHRLDRDAD